VALLALSACMGRQIQSRSPSFAIIDSLTARLAPTSGFCGQPRVRRGSLIVNALFAGQSWSQPTMVEDHGRFSMHLALADPATAQPATSIAANTIHLHPVPRAYLLADGRSVGPDWTSVGFRGGLTFSLTGTASVTAYVVGGPHAKPSEPALHSFRAAARRRLSRHRAGNLLRCGSCMRVGGGKGLGSRRTWTGNINLHFSELVGPGLDA